LSFRLGFASPVKGGRL